MAKVARRVERDGEDDDREECPFCHKLIAADRLEAHVERHTERRDDGQMKDHVTLRKDKRFGGSLRDVPRVYLHRRCDGQTEMPDDIIRSYLADPFLYNDKTFCTGCNDYVPMKQCEWTETGQRLDEYMKELQDEAIRTGRVSPPSATTWLLGGAGVSLVLGALIGGVKWGVKGGAIGAVLGLVAGCAFAWYQYSQEKAKFDAASRRARRKKPS